MKDLTVESPPRLTIETGGTLTGRRAPREVLSGCSVVEEGDLSHDRGESRAVEEAAQNRLDLIEGNYRKAIGCAATLPKPLTAYARNYAEELRHPEKPLPKSDNKPEPFTAYVKAPPEYENTAIVSAFDSEGVEILSMRVTGATSVRAAALRHAWELLDEMKAANPPKLTLVRS